MNNRGIGGSTDHGESFDIAKLADDTARVIETLGIQRASVTGWSMGGFIAQALALKYPERVAARRPALIAAGTEDIVIPSSSAETCK